jgi:uncharacterized damage-inducible protein DinB
MEAEILETWAIHNRINLYLLEAIEPDALKGVSASKGRSVGAQFAHIHNVRLMWLDSAAPTLMVGLSKIEKDGETDKARLKSALEASGDAIETLLRQSLAEGSRVKGFKPHTVAFMGYLISHESYHRGEIGIILSA